MIFCGKESQTLAAKKKLWVIQTETEERHREKGEQGEYAHQT
jgi:hypothetical protein